jgi:tripartite-type tricarboxylate transporter receptor subunit TctC
MKLTKRIGALVLAATAAATASVMGLAQTAGAANHPARPVIWVVPYAPGAATDALARLMAEETSKSLKQSVVVENQPGAATATAASQLKRADPDGYRVMSADITTLVLNPILRQGLAYDPEKDFSMISMLARLPLVLVGRPDLPQQSLTELLNYARANPGKLTYASPGQGSPHHMAMEMLQSEGGVSLLHVPYSGTGPSMTDLLAGRIDLTFASVGSVAPYLASGKLKAYGISMDKPFAALPDVAPLRDQDNRLKDFEAYSWQGLIAPAGLPAAEVKALNDAVVTALNNPAIVNKLEGLGLTAESSSPEAFKNYVREQRATWAKVAQEKNLKLD